MSITYYSFELKALCEIIQNEMNLIFDG